MNKFANRLLGCLLLAYPAMLSWEYGFFDTWLGERLLIFAGTVACFALFVGIGALGCLLFWALAVIVWELVVHGELR